MVGNKSDLEDSRKLEYEEAENYAKTNDIVYYEVSAYTGDGIDQLLNDIARALPNRMVERETLQANKLKSRKRKSCVC